MNTLKLPLLALAATLSLGSIAQEKEKTEKKEKKSKTVVITQDGDESEKMTIVVDGDKVTVNGKPVQDYKGNVKVLDRSSIYTPRGVNGVRSMAKVGRVAPGAGFYAFGGNKAFLGVTTEDGEGGAKITEITKESAAEKAGLKVGDVITKIGEYNVADADDVYAALGQLKPEQKVSITYTRDGKQGTAEAVLAKNNTTSQSFAFGDGDFDFDFDHDHSFNGTHSVFYRRPKLGLQVQDVEEGSGVKVLDVDDETPAAKAGLKKDDVIVKLNGTEIKGVDDVRKQAKELKEGDTLKVEYKRGGNTQNAEIKFPKRLKKADL